jgi:hypothetical protein
MRTFSDTNDGDAPETLTIYLRRPQPLRGQIACTACGNPFGEPWIRFFREGAPVCKKCALRFGFTIEREGRAPMRCQRSEGGAIELFEE